MHGNLNYSYKISYHL